VSLSDRRVDDPRAPTGARCRSTHTGRSARSAVAARRRVEKSCDPDLTVRTEDGSVVLSIDGDDHVLSDEAAARVRESLGDALQAERTFVHTAGERRPDGTYVVRRRDADSAGHRKVFDSRADLRALFERLPEAFTAADIATDGLSGGRRHMVLRHLAEHPAFDCSLVRRQPLTARKHGTGSDGP
jgi:hypothetical protein